MDLAALAAGAAGLVRPGCRVVLGVAGMPGAGKSTFAAALVSRLNAQPPPGAAAADVSARGVASRPEWAAVLPMDGFHHPQARLVERGLRDRMGAPETFDATAYAEVLERVTASHEPVLVPSFDRTVEEPRPDGLRIEPWHRLVVTEGSYLLLPFEPWASARRRIASVWYLCLAERTRVERLVARHVRFGKSPQEAAAWVTRVDQANARLVARHADAADAVLSTS